MPWNFLWFTKTKWLRCLRLMDFAQLKYSNGLEREKSTRLWYLNRIYIVVNYFLRTFFFCISHNNKLQSDVGILRNKAANKQWCLPITNVCFFAVNTSFCQHITSVKADFQVHVCSWYNAAKFCSKWSVDWQLGCWGRLLWFGCDNKKAY